MEDGQTKVVWTPLKILQWAVPYLTEKGVTTPKLDAELLLAHALQIDRLKVYLQFDRPLDASELAKLREMLRRRAAHEPIQYITGKREFYGFPFSVAPGALIPRPETEALVERGLEFLKGMPEDRRRVLDLGTGTGCIALSLAKSLLCAVWALDISEKALEIAKKNSSELLTVENIQWRQGDWFSALRPGDPEVFDLIVSNPPYIPLQEKKELDPQVLDWEPPEALFGGEDGLEAYRRLAVQIKGKLAPGGLALFELHPNQSDNIAGLFKPLGWGQTLLKDLQGLPRVLCLQNNPEVKGEGEDGA